MDPVWTSPLRLPLLPPRSLWQSQGKATRATRQSGPFLLVFFIKFKKSVPIPKRPHPFSLPVWRQTARQLFLSLSRRLRLRERKPQSAAVCLPEPRQSPSVQVPLPPPVDRLRAPPLRLPSVPALTVREPLLQAHFKVAIKVKFPPSPLPDSLSVCRERSATWSMYLPVPC